MAEFELHGPFEMPCDRVAGHILKSHAGKFWEGDARDLADRFGCYVFGLRRSHGTMPFYVGKTVRSFRAEVFDADKLLKYIECLTGQVGTPIMFLLPYPHQQGRPGTSQVDELETFLIQSARVVNPDFINVSKTHSEEWGIAGVLQRGATGELKRGRGRLSDSAEKFRSLMGWPAPARAARDVEHPRNAEGLGAAAEDPAPDQPLVTETKLV